VIGSLFASHRRGCGLARSGERQQYRGLRGINGKAEALGGSLAKNRFAAASLSGQHKNTASGSKTNRSGLRVAARPTVRTDSCHSLMGVTIVIVSTRSPWSLVMKAVLPNALTNFSSTGRAAGTTSSDESVS
jgi:hypothetical protein